MTAVLPPVTARGVLLALVVGLALLLPGLARALPIERVVSPGGIEAWLVRDEKNPIISLRFAFDGGTELDPPEKLGLSTMAAALLDEGAGDLDSQAFQKLLEDNSIDLGFGAARDGVFGNLTTLRETRGEAFRLLRLALTDPRFDPDDMERIRSQMIAGLRRSLTEPNYIAQRTLYEVLYPDHPYGKPGGGTLQTVPTITREDLVEFPKTRLGRDRLAVAVSGDITAEELAPLLDQVFGGLPATTPPITVADQPPRTKGEILAVPLAIPQSILALAQPGLKRQDPDWFPAFILNYVLGGGGFSSRLVEEVREKRGLTYGVTSSLQPLDHSAVMVAGGSTSNDKAGKALDLIKQIWADVAREGITEAELADAKTYLTGSFPLSLTSNEAIAGVLLQVKRDKLGIDYLTRRSDLINAVTLEDVKRVAGKLLDPAALTTVVVGQPEGVTPTVTRKPFDG